MRCLVIKTMITIICLIVVSLLHPLQARVVSKHLNLKGGTLILEPNENLCFVRGGRIINGKIEGRNSKLLTLSKKAWCLHNVELTGLWEGSVSDVVFKYCKKSKAHYQTVANMFQFDTLTFSKRDYYLEKWETVKMKAGNVLVEGNGVRFILPSNKGKTFHTEWGDRYTIHNLFSSGCEEDSQLTIKDITILDNTEHIKGWGENVTVEEPVIYFYFSPGQHSFCFENVNSDGCGALLHTYNFDHNSGDQVFKNCHIKTSQFGIELGNRQTAHTDKVIIEDCVFKRYNNAIFVGPVSVVGDDNQLDSLIIRNSVFNEPHVGNIEVSGAKYVQFTGNDATNLFCYSGSQPPEVYECTYNKFTLRSGLQGKTGVSMKIAGNDITIKSNEFDIVEKPFPFIEIANPDLVENMVVYNNKVIYEPSIDVDGFHCLFSFSTVKGDFEFYGNTFESTYNEPHFNNYFPKKMKRFEDAFMNKVNNHMPINN